MKIIGKSNTLIFIKKKLPHIPIPLFKKIGKNNIFPGLTAKRIAATFNYPIIIRSDGPEDKLGLSYAGLFESIIVKSKDDWIYSDIFNKEKLSKLDRVKKGFDRFKIKTYNSIRNIKNIHGNIDIFIQQFIETDILLTITSHPHQENKYFIDINMNRDVDSTVDRAGFIVSANLASDFEHKKPLLNFLKNYSNDLVASLQTALNYFIEIENAFGRSISYQAEFVLHPIFLLQFRPFRKKEFADFKIKNFDFKHSQKTIHIPIVFGVTPKNGLRLLHYSDFTTYFDILSSTVDSLQEFPDPNYVLKKTVERLYAENNIQEIIVSLPELKYFSLELEDKNKLPGVTIFNINTKYYSWQTHDCFRLLERGSIVGLSTDSPFVSLHGHDAIFWSDGYQGILQFL